VSKKKKDLPLHYPVPKFWQILGNNAPKKSIKSGA
jgi:hypothetical protein